MSIDPTVVKVPEYYEQDITFVCTGTVPKDLVVDKEITWLVNGEEIAEGVGPTTTPQGRISTRHLRVTSPRNAGVYNYTCRVTVAVVGDQPQMAASTAQLIVTDGESFIAIPSNYTNRF